MSVRNGHGTPLRSWLDAGRQPSDAWHRYLAGRDVGRRSRPRGAATALLGVKPVAELGVAGGVLARVELAAELADRAEALGEHLVVVDRLEVQLPREDEVVVPEVVDLLEGSHAR